MFLLRLGQDKKSTWIVANNIGKPIGPKYRLQVRTIASVAVLAAGPYRWLAHGLEQNMVAFWLSIYFQYPGSIWMMLKVVFNSSIQLNIHPKRHKHQNDYMAGTAWGI